MRTSGLPNFKKPWGRIEKDLPVGIYSVEVKNNYNSSEWNGNRFFILTTLSIVGGKNYILPITFMLISVLSFIAVIFFWRRFRLLADVSKFQLWLDNWLYIYIIFIWTLKKISLNPSESKLQNKEKDNKKKKWASKVQTSSATAKQINVVFENSILTWTSSTVPLKYGNNFRSCLNQPITVNVSDSSKYDVFSFILIFWVSYSF